ncbi:MAG: Fic family protein [Bryobacteraceae bacterium]|nr:Fic family protein [Bryobacteraceae bacterium]
MGHKWKPIEGLSSEPLGDGELRYLTEVWQDIQRDSSASQKLAELQERLKREWSIETGAIEGVYTLDAGTTRTLIERGIHADWIDRTATNLDPEHLVQILQDQQAALELVFSFVKSERPFSKGLVKEIHAVMVRSQGTYTGVDQFGSKFPVALEPGKFKERPNNPVGRDGEKFEYCPPVQVESEMDRLVQMYSEAADRVPVEDLAAWLHHRFVLIHPFPDGNGRVARTLASLVFHKAALFPVTVRRGEERERYIRCLESADDGDLKPLVQFFVKGQRQAIMLAARFAREI